MALAEGFNWNMSKIKFNLGFVFHFLSVGLLTLSVGSVQGNPRRVPTAPIVEDSIPHFGIIAHSPDQLIRNAITRLIKKDIRGLILMGPDPELMMSIYKKTPQGKTASEVQLNFFREFYYMDNGKLLERSLGKYGGKNFELISWKANKPPEQLDGGGKILRGLEIWVKDFNTNTEEKISFLQSIYIDKNGCKIWGFKDHKGGDDSKKE